MKDFNHIHDFSGIMERDKWIKLFKNDIAMPSLSDGSMLTLGLQILRLVRSSYDYIRELRFL